TLNQEGSRVQELGDVSRRVRPGKERICLGRSCRMKGQGNQVSNGPKDHVNEHEDFDSWRTQHHQKSVSP
ncbi:Uncharacterized protein GBIM_00644, partial [Gryllus bimaculatus]